MALLLFKTLFLIKPILLCKPSSFSDSSYLSGDKFCNLWKTLMYLQVFFEKIFLTRPFKALFVTSDDSIHEWRFRWQLDRYVSK